MATLNGLDSISKGYSNEEDLKISGWIIATFVMYAESYGAKGHRVESAEAYLPLVERCIDEPGVHVIDCPIDYSENDRILNTEIRERSLALL